MCFPGAWLAHRFHGEGSWKWQMGRGAGVGLAGTQGTPYFGHFSLSSSPWKRSEHVWMWHLRPWVSGDHGGAAGLAILKAFSSHNDFVTDSRSCDFRFLDSLGCRDGSWGTHPAAPHNKQPHKPHKSHSCCNPWLPGHHQSLPIPFRPNTLGESVELGGHPGGHPHPVPTGMWPGSTNPIPWAHPVLSPALASPALQMGSSPAPLQIHTRPGHLQGMLAPRGAQPGDMRVDSAQGCEHGQCPGK